MLNITNYQETLLHCWWECKLVQPHGLITKDEHDETSRWLRAEPKEKSILGHRLVLRECLEQTVKRDENQK